MKPWLARIFALAVMAGRARMPRPTRSSTVPISRTRSATGHSSLPISTGRRASTRHRWWWRSTAAAGRPATARSTGTGARISPSNGYAVFAISYRLSKPGAKSFPDAVYDVKAAVQFVRARAGELGVDPERIGLMGDSAGAHLAALTGLAAGEPQFSSEYQNDPNAAVSPSVKAVVGFYGVYDMLAQWEHDQIARPRDQITEKFLGGTPMLIRRAYFDASPDQLRDRGQEPHPLPAGLRHGGRHRRSGDAVAKVPHRAQAGRLLRARHVAARAPAISGSQIRSRSPAATAAWRRRTSCGSSPVPFRSAGVINRRRRPLPQRRSCSP